MVLSIPRPRAHAAEDEQAYRFGRPTWAMERGASCWTTVADVAGAFPGFARQGGLLAGSRVRVTERYLLVDEGRGHGFGLPLAAIQRLAIGAAGETGARQKAVLHIVYTDGGGQRSFLIRPRADRFGWPRDRFDEALRAFRQAGHEPRPASPVPALAISWEEARRFRDENVIWSGRVTAPLDTLGLKRAGADVWLTTRSLMWSAGADHGINRVPMARIVDVLPAELSDQATTPVLVVGHQTDQDERRDLVFIFDRHLPAERNGRERGAVLTSFRSRGIELGTPPDPRQPWRRDWWPTDVAPAASMSSAPLAPEPAPVLETPVAVSAAAPAPVADLVRIRAYEAEALSLLADTNARARGLLPVADDPGPMAALGTALAEIEAAEASGALTREQASSRRAAILALGEAGSRLIAVFRLYQTGQLSGERLEARRLAILRPLNRLIPGPERAAT